MKAAILLLLPMAALAQPPEHVTSDTKEYCFDLARHLDEAGAMPPEVRLLWLDGRAMCEQGKVPGGLLRLRHALMILHPEPK